MNNAYADEFAELNETPPPQPEIQKLTRHILIEKPRVTKFQIDWEEEDSAPGLMPQISQQPQQQDLMAAGTQNLDRSDMMRPENLQAAAQNFQQ